MQVVHWLPFVMIRDRYLPETRVIDSCAVFPSDSALEMAWDGEEECNMVILSHLYRSLRLPRFSALELVKLTTTSTLPDFCESCRARTWRNGRGRHPRSSLPVFCFHTGPILRQLCRGWQRSHSFLIVPVRSTVTSAARAHTFCSQRALGCLHLAIIPLANSTRC